MNTLPAFANYLIYLALSGILLTVFFVIYTRVTPFNEVLLIRQGNIAAAFSLGGAIVGFSLTVVSAIMHTTGYPQFLAWAGAAIACVPGVGSLHQDVQGTYRIGQYCLRRFARRDCHFGWRHQRSLHFVNF